MMLILAWDNCNRHSKFSGARIGQREEQEAESDDAGSILLMDMPHFICSAVDSHLDDFLFSISQRVMIQIFLYIALWGTYVHILVEYILSSRIWGF